MNMLKRGAAALLAIPLASTCLPVHAGAPAMPGAPVGVEVYVQAWNPLTPDQDTPSSVLNEPRGISGRMNAAWDQARAMLGDPKYPQSVPALLSKGGLIAKGVNLYDIHFTTRPLAAVTLTPGGGPNGPQTNAFTLHWVIPGTHLDFRATTPDVTTGIGVARDLDPKLSVQCDLDISLGLAVSDQPGQPLLQVTQTVVHIVNPQVDSGNFSGDVIKAISDFVTNVAYGKNLNSLLAWTLGDKNLAADPQHGGLDVAGLRGIDVAGIANDKLKPLNEKIAATHATSMVRVGLWAKGGAGGQMLALLFAPKMLPLPPQNGAMSGMVTFDNSVDTAKLPASCSAIIGKDGVDVEVQTGPRKIVDVDPMQYGAAPLMRLLQVSFGGGPVANRRCAFTLNGLVEAWPNIIAFPAPGLGSRGSLGSIGRYVQLTPENWSSPVVQTAPLSNHNLMASISMAYKAGVGAMRQPQEGRVLIDKGDPSPETATSTSAWGARQVRAGQAAATAGAESATSVSRWGNAPAAAEAGSLSHGGLAGSRLKKSTLGANSATVNRAPAAPAAVQPAAAAQP
ncbi:MAG: hypothetical protein QM808_07305 [Steroidobacteraceae bacterium]